MIAILNGQLETVDRFTPESMSLNLEERKSTAVLTAAMDTPEISCGTWLRYETEPGKGIIWRVKSIDRQFEKNIKTYQLEHVIATLRDVIIFGEVTAKQMGGGDNCTAKQAAQKALSEATEAEEAANKNVDTLEEKIKQLEANIKTMEASKIGRAHV